MSNEEAINVLKEHIDTYMVCHGEEDTVAVSLDNVDVEALNMAIKALEQEPILDKIRAKMDGLLNDEDNLMYAHGVMDCLKIIDKYKQKSEEQKEYEAEIITRGNCMICGKKLTEGLFICKECGDRANKAESEE